jgi:AGCS family alanine or glycine:cation symporter
MTKRYALSPKLIGHFLLLFLTAILAATPAVAQSPTPAVDEVNESINSPVDLSDEENRIAAPEAHGEDTDPTVQPDSSDEADDAASSETATSEKPAEEKTILGHVNSWLFSVLFYDLARGNLLVEQFDKNGQPEMENGKQKMAPQAIPMLIVVLAAGAFFFSIYYGFVNFRGFLHAINIVRGKYDCEEDAGEISHFRALTSALSATIGLGNIAGVAIAIQVGGPGAVFWMIFLALFGMSSKFSSCTLSQLYRKVNPDGSISGGPMYYLDIGLRQKGEVWGLVGKTLAVMYAVMVMGGAIGGGNMFQANQTVEAFVNTFQIQSESAPMFIGVLMAVLVGAVILGGIKRIGAATSRIVPLMCGLYIIASIIVIVANISAVPAALTLIFTMAFTDNALFGGAVGVIVKGVQRAAFSNEAGLGSAAIAHAAAKTDEPVREGMVAMLGPFIDTVIVCLMTSLVIIVTGAWNNPAITSVDGNVGVALTNHAFSTVIPSFPYILTICIGLFAYSTMISWCYYGERGWIYLLDHFGDGIGLKTVSLFRIFFVLCVIIGATNKLGDVLDFADAMILSMAFPNIIGSIVLAPHVKEKLKDYWGRYKSGAFNVA